MSDQLPWNDPLRPPDVKPLKPPKELFSDAIAAYRDLKRKHRDFYSADAKAYRAMLRKAERTVNHQKPGPKPKDDPHIRQAAHKRSRDITWRELYPLHINGYAQMSEYTRAYAEDGFRRKVNQYLREHPMLKLRNTTRSKNPA